MAFLLKLFGIDLEDEKRKKFREFGVRWAEDPEILKQAKVGWLLSRGEEMIKKGYPNQTIQDGEEALQIDPESISAYEALIGAYALVRRFKDAAKISRQCLEMIEISKDEEVKAQKMDIYFLQGMLGLEINDVDIVVNCFYNFLDEEKRQTKNPVWQEMMKNRRIVSECILDKDCSPLEEHQQHVKMARDTLRGLKDKLSPEAQKLVSRVL